MSDYLKPSSRGIRSPTTNAKNNGDLVNPPRFPDTTGMKSGNAFKKNAMKIKPPR